MSVVINNEVISPLHTQLRKWSIYPVLIVLIFACIVLIGWQFDIDIFKKPFSNAGAINPTTAVSFILAAISFLLSSYSPNTPLKNKSGIVVTMVIIITGLLKLGNEFLNWPLYVDQIFFAQRMATGVMAEASNQMVPITAVNFILVGVGLLLTYNVNIKAQGLAQLVAIAAALIALFSIVGYIYHVREFYTVLVYKPMAIHTALCFFLFSTGLLFARPDLGLMKQFNSHLSGGFIGRVLMPLVVAIPIALGYALLRINWQILFSVEFAVAVLIMSITVVFAVVIWLNISLLNKQDTLRHNAETTLIQLNKALQIANEEMIALNKELLSGNEKLNQAHNIIKEQTEVIVKQKEEQFTRILDSLNDVVWSRDLTGGRNNYLSHSAEVVFNRPYHVLFNDEISFLDYVHPQDIVNKQRSKQQLKETGSSECTYRITHPDGKIRWLYDRSKLIKDAQGNITREEGVATDITSFKQHQYNVDLIFNSIPETFILLDSSLIIIAFNNVAQQRCKKLMNCTLEEGKNILLLIPKKYQQIKERFEKVFLGDVVKIETISFNDNNEGLFFSVSYFPIKTEDQLTHVVITAMDITERKLAERKVEQEHNLMRALIDNIPDNIYIKDAQLRYELVNQSILKLLKKPMQEVIGKSDTDLVSSKKILSHNDDDLQVLQSGISIINKETPYSISGKKRWSLLTKVPIKDEAGNVTGLISIGRDITKRKNMEEVLRLNQYHLEKAQAVGHIGHWISELTDNDGALIWSKETYHIFGLTEKEFDGRVETFFKYIHPDDYDLVKSAAKLTLEEGSPYNIDHRIILPNGKVRWVHQQAEITLGSDDRMVMVGVVQDITEQKLAEEELIASKRNLDTLINNTKDLIWLVDKDLKLILANKAFDEVIEKRFNLKIEIGQPIITSPINGEYDKWGYRLRQVLKGEQFIVEENFKSKDGKSFYNEITLNPVYDEKQRVIGAGCFSRDVTERKYFEQKLKYFIEQYDIVSMATNDAIWDWHLETDTIVWNHGLKTIFGYEEKEITYSKNWRAENIHPEDQSTFIKEIEETFTNHRTNFSCTYRFRCSNGVYKYVFDRAYVIYDNEKPKRMIGAIQDIDDRMGNLEEVKKLSLVASKTDNAVTITDKNNKIEWINNSFTRLTGYTLKEVIGRKPSEFLYGIETDPDVNKRIEEKLKKGESLSDELICYSKTGKKYWLKLSITPIFDDSDELEKFISILSDITEQKEFEKNITSIARELANLIEYANTPIFGIDRNGYINEWNRVTAELTGYDKNEVLGKKLLEGFIEPHMWSIVNEQLQKIFQGVSIGNFELPIYTRNKDRIIILLNATPRRNASLEIIGALIVGQNITELIEYRQNLEKKVEERTRALNESLQKEKELVEMKNKFVSMVSHEFRTPLSSISLASGFIKKYQNRISPEETEAKLDNIEKQVRHMTFLLNDILTIGKSEAGKIQAQLTPLPLKSLLLNLIRDVEQGTNNTHKVKLVFNCSLETIRSDEKLLRNIIINLLTNAIKFSPNEKSVTLQVDSIINKLQIQTQDHGIGISPDDLPNIFTAFHRGNNVGVVQGTGLGLSITKKAVDLLEGDIKVKSEIGKGTLFIITLPLN